MKMESRIKGIISEKDKDSRITQCNHVFWEYAGLASDNSILGLTDYDFPWQEYADIYRKHELEVLAGNDYSIVFPFITGTGESKVFLHSKAAKYNAVGEIIGVQCHALEMINPDVHRLFAYLVNKSPESVTGFSLNKHKQVNLTRREKEILFFISKTKTAKQIALVLGLSSRTVYSHVENIKFKLNCRTKSELADAAYAMGFAQELPDLFSVKSLLSKLEVE